MAELSVEQQLREVAARLLKQTRPVHKPKERDRSAGYSTSKAEMARTGWQLAEMVLAYLDGELKASTWDGDEPPF